MTTKVRLIENVIAEFLARDGWRIDQETGEAILVFEDDVEEDITITVDVPKLAAAIMDEVETWPR